jgi:hypothetical protein
MGAVDRKREAQNLLTRQVMVSEFALKVVQY